MKIGLHIRNSGPHATRDTVRDCARIADANPAIDDLWVYDHLAIPPEESEGSEGYYLDPLATLAFIAGDFQHAKPSPLDLVYPDSSRDQELDQPVRIDIRNVGRLRPVDRLGDGRLVDRSRMRPAGDVPLKAGTKKPGQLIRLTALQCRNQLSADVCLNFNRRVFGVPDFLLLRLIQTGEFRNWIA